MKNLVKLLFSSLALFNQKSKKSKTRLFSLVKQLDQVSLKSSETQTTHSKTVDPLSKIEVGLDALVTEVLDLRKRLNQSQQELSEAKTSKLNLISRISHEIRNPIHGILGINSLILKREDSMPIWDLVKMGDFAAEGLLSVVDELLDFTRAEEGTFEFERVSFNPVMIVRDSMQSVTSRLEGKYSYDDNKRLELVVDIDSSIPTSLRGDPKKLQKILVSLLGNAIKFTPSGHVGIKVTTATVDSKFSLVMSVWDTGVGIAPEKLSRLLSSFPPQVCLLDNDKGTGIGLIIVKKLIESMGGILQVKSELNVGSTFSVSLPIDIIDSPDYSNIFVKSKPLPKDAILLGQRSPKTDALCRNLIERGIQTRHFDLLSNNVVGQLDKQLIKTEMLVVIEDALAIPRILPILRERTTEFKKCTITVIRPSSIRLKENLFEIGLKQILHSPVFVDDLINIFQGQPPEIAVRETLGTPVLDLDRKLRVLVADDMPPNRFILQEMLEESGHDVVCVNDGKCILDRISPMLFGEQRSEIFDLIITDITMSSMDGDVAARNIRAIEKERAVRKHLPIIAVTGHIFEEERSRIEQSGVDAILYKPMNMASLSKELWRIFQ